MGKTPSRTRITFISPTSSCAGCCPKANRNSCGILCPPLPCGENARPCGLTCSPACAPTWRTCPGFSLGASTRCRPCLPSSGCCAASTRRRVRRWGSWRPGASAPTTSNWPSAMPARLTAVPSPSSCTTFASGWRSTWTTTTSMTSACGNYSHASAASLSSGETTRFREWLAGPGLRWQTPGLGSWGWISWITLGLMTMDLAASGPSLSQGENESRSVLSNSLGCHGLCSPWCSPGQNTGVGSLSLLQGIFPTQGVNPSLPHCRRILYQLSHKGSPLSQGGRG